MWGELLRLIEAARRPLVFVDFETCGLGGLPPVEFALAYYAPWQTPEQDETSRSARAMMPPGLTYAASWRLSPGGCPIAPAATRVHGITDADVRGAMDFRDLGLRAVFRSLAEGDAAAGEGPAVWAGHNLAESDVPWAQGWGLLPAEPPTADPWIVDTMRLARRLTADHPHPLAVDYVAEDVNGRRRCPVIEHGLTPYRDTLPGLHTALFGDPHEGGHGALADVAATARCLAAALALWEPLWPGRVLADAPQQGLSRLLGALATPPIGMLAWDGWVQVDRDTGVHAWGRKARKVGEGRPITTDRSYAAWVMGLPAAPTGKDGEAWCAPESRRAIETALAGAKGKTK